MGSLQGGGQSDSAEGGGQKHVNQSDWDGEAFERGPCWPESSILKLDVVVHTCNLSIWEAETGESTA
jgi:hypothetical protein